MREINSIKNRYFSFEILHIWWVYKNMKSIKDMNRVAVFICGFVVGLISGILFLTKYKESDCVVSVEAGDVQGTQEIWVDVQGAVNKPGVYKLSQTFRVGEALDLAEGVSLSASPEWFSKNINLSRKLADGDKLYIPFEWEVYKSEEGYLLPLFFEKAETSEAVESQPIENSEASSQQSVSGLINVNSAAVEDLDTLPGIGPAYAQKIEDNRPYADLSELIEKSGVPESTLNKIQDQISY